MMDDAELLRRYAEESSEAAFAELVERHLNLVYRTALRRTNGDAHRAVDVSQAVFTALAREAAALRRHAFLAGWLYTATRNAAHNAMREEQRRRTREQEAHRMHELNTEAPETNWATLRPMLDAALDDLDARDRHAVILRFFESRPLAHVGLALGLSEDAARKRVDRALEKLRVGLARRGVPSTAAALGAVLAAEAAYAAPAGLAASIAGSALATAAGAGAAPLTAFLTFMNTSKIAVVAMGILAAVAIGTTGYRIHACRVADAAVAAAQVENDALAARLRGLQANAEVRPASTPATPTTVAKGPVAAKAPTSLEEMRQQAEAVMVRHPELRQAMIDQLRAWAVGGKAPLFRSLGLSAAEIERVVDLSIQGMSGGTVANEVSIPYSVGGDRGAAERELRQLLGEERYAEYRTFTAIGAPAHREITELAGLLYRTSSPLTMDQADRLQRIVAAHGEKVSGLPEPRFDWTAIMAQARGVLSEPQITVLGYLRAQDEASRAVDEARSASVRAAANRAKTQPEK